jgi:hypothetical protein
MKDKMDRYALLPDATRTSEDGSNLIYSVMHIIIHSSRSTLSYAYPEKFKMLKTWVGMTLEKLHRQ